MQVPQELIKQAFTALQLTIHAIENALPDKSVHRTLLQHFFFLLPLQWIYSIKQSTFVYQKVRNQMKSNSLPICTTFASAFPHVQIHLLFIVSVNHLGLPKVYHSEGKQNCSEAVKQSTLHKTKFISHLCKSLNMSVNWSAPGPGLPR